MWRVIETIVCLYLAVGILTAFIADLIVPIGSMALAMILFWPMFWAMAIIFGAAALGAP